MHTPTHTTHTTKKNKKTKNKKQKIKKYVDLYIFFYPEMSDILRIEPFIEK